MSLISPSSKSSFIVYPESDGKPLADNTKQLRWIVTLYGNIATQLRGTPDVFVAGDLLWYPVEGHPEIATAPDVMVCFGRPRGDRGSYRQWEEADVPATVVFEVLSPGYTAQEFLRKQDFYDEYGVEEYYIYDPDAIKLTVWIRQGQVLRRVRPVQGFVSPRLRIRFDLSGPDMVVYGPDGQRFLTFEELTEERDRERQLRQDAEDKAEKAHARARITEERLARLAELSRKARRNQATPAELAELERLEEQA